MATDYIGLKIENLGISVTDFYITSTYHADVNVEPNTTYYYSVKPVLDEETMVPMRVVVFL